MRRPRCRPQDGFGPGGEKGEKKKKEREERKSAAALDVLNSFRRLAEELQEKRADRVGRTLVSTLLR